MEQDMDNSTLKSWFASLSDTEKSEFLVSLMHQISVVTRGVTHEKDSESAARIMYSLSELNHHLTSKVIAWLKGQPSFPDNTIIDGALNTLSASMTPAESGHVLEVAARSVTKAD